MQTTTGRGVFLHIFYIRRIFHLFHPSHPCNLLSRARHLVKEISAFSLDVVQTTDATYAMVCTAHQYSFLQDSQKMPL